MKYINILIFNIMSIVLIGQNNPRAVFENELQLIADSLQEETNARFEKGPMFIFDEPYMAVFTKSMDYSVGVPSGGVKTNFSGGDTIIVLGAQPVGKVLRFKSRDSDAIFVTRAFGYPGFEVLNSDEFYALVRKIKSSDWKKAEQIASMLSCGTFELIGKPNFEKHHISIGDTPVFFQLRLESNRILLYLDLRTYGGNDFKDMGVAEADQSTMNLVFGDESNASVKCYSDNDRFAIFDLTDLRSQFLSGVNEISIELSRKSITKKLNGMDQFAIGLKMECIEQSK